MAQMQITTARQAMINAAALGATHSQRWEVLHDGHWRLFSLAFYDLDAPARADGLAVEVATWQAGFEVFDPQERLSCYAKGRNLDRSERDQMFISIPERIGPEFYGEGAI
ncbi:hypothetical protein phiA034_gene0053 [Aeromonas phage phiA034]|uniref:Uncharacterized protein n=1 Tax=Aeromonas phage phiA034 TaxID=2985287 RepID=A0AAE9YL74_9CAUD|nr:hypothetical protein pAEv1812_64 [Aeromonas phage pAEv1812]WCZ66136.1 hypothetical protein phiA034_gene0053 [Aeromonas phage phiA034]